MKRSASEPGLIYLKAQRAENLTLQSNATPQRAKNPANQRANETNGGITYLNGQRFRLTMNLSASTGKEYCESTDKCNS